MNCDKMDIRNVFSFLLLTSSQFVYSQKNDSLAFIEIGIGGGYTQSLHGAFNAGLSKNLTDHVAAFIEYNRFFGKSNLLFHEISLKFGPYYKFSPNSYIALSTGFSMFFNPSKPDIGTTRINTGSGTINITTMDEDNYLINIPVQFRVHLGLDRKFGLGIKGTYNYVPNKSVEDKGSFLFYLAIRL
jgi:hypothetical protein